MDSLPDGLGQTARIDTTRPLTELTPALAGICQEVEDRPGKSVVVLHLDSPPVDSRAWPGAVGIRDVNRWERQLRRLERLAAMTIAVVDGPCGGAALDLVLATDFRIASPDALLMLPVNDGHFWPGTGLFRLVQHLGVAQARRVVLWGDDIPVRQALDMGLVDQVSDNVADDVHTATVLMGRISDQELALRRQLLLEAASVEYEEALGIHLAACDRELRRLGTAVPAAVDSGRQR